MKILITGGGGFIGSHLVEDQLSKGRDVIALDLHFSCLPEQKDSSNLKLVQGDIRDTKLLNKLLENVDTVFHLASAHLSIKLSDQDYWDINVKACETLARLAQAHGVKRFVHCSSVGIYGEIKNPPAVETAPFNPDIIYEKTKLSGEQALMQFYKESSFPITIIRPTWVYGPRCERTKKLFRSIKKGNFVMVGNGEAQRHCVYISDLLNAFEAARQSEQAIGEAFIIGDNNAVSLNQLVNTIAGIVNTAPPKIRVPYALMYPICSTVETVFKISGREPPISRRSLKFFTNSTSFDISKAKNYLSYSPTFNLLDGLNKTYQHIEWK